MRFSWIRATLGVALGGSALAVALSASVAALTPAALPALPPPPVPHAPVRTLVGPFWTPTASELATLDRGLAIVRTLPSSVSEEITFIGAIQLKAPAARFVERFRDIERLDGGRGIPRIKRMSQPATLADLATLELNADDLKSLRACTPGACAIKLPGAAIARVQREVDWNAADAAARANRILRETLLERVAAYQRDGDRGLAAYNDHETPLHGGEANGALLAREALLAAHLPQLLTYVRDFPRATLPGVEDFYFWANVEFGLKPTLRLSHVTIYRAPPNRAGIVYAIVTKQLYASHYFQGSVEVRFLMDTEPAGGLPPGSAGAATGGQAAAGAGAITAAAAMNGAAMNGGSGSGGCYLVIWINARSDGMTGVLGPIVRLQVRRKSRTGVVDYLERVKARVEGRPAGA